MHLQQPQRMQRFSVLHMTATPLSQNTESRCRIEIFWRLLSLWMFLSRALSSHFCYNTDMHSGTRSTRLPWSLVHVHVQHEGIFKYMCAFLLPVRSWLKRCPAGSQMGFSAAALFPFCKPSWSLLFYNYLLLIHFIPFAHHPLILASSFKKNKKLFPYRFSPCPFLSIFTSLISSPRCPLLPWVIPLCIQLFTIWMYISIHSSPILTLSLSLSPWLFLPFFLPSAAVSTFPEWIPLWSPSLSLYVCATKQF